MNWLVYIGGGACFWVIYVGFMKIFLTPEMWDIKNNVENVIYLSVFIIAPILIWVYICWEFIR